MHAVLWNLYSEELQKPYLQQDSVNRIGKKKSKRPSKKSELKVSTLNGLVARELPGCLI